MSLIVLGAVVALYCLALYPAYLPKDPDTERALQVLLGEPINVARLHDRLAGITFAAALMLAGGFLLIRLRRFSSAGD